MPKILGFDEQYISALCEARNYASITGSTPVRVPHLLLGLILTSNIATVYLSSILSKNGKELIDLWKEIETCLARTKKIKKPIDPHLIRYNRQSNLVMEYARHFAADGGSTMVGCDHLLLGIYGERGHSADILTSMGIHNDIIQRKMRLVLNF
ncbi:MAG: hypothetical protein JWL80_593 [Parcubacteria group bacterium]|nr:hypothetical protein [Parcubacteria group bacterium]